MPDNKPPVDRYLDEHPNFGYWAGTVIGAVLTLVGCAVIFQLLTTPTEHMPDFAPPSHCLPASRLIDTPNDADVSADREGTVGREQCNRIRENDIATAILVAVPTSMAGSLTGIAVLFHRRLVPHQQSSKQGGQASD